MEYVLPQNLNGPHRSVAAKTVDSVQLLRQSLEHRQQNMGQFSYNKTNFLTELHEPGCRRSVRSSSSKEPGHHCVTMYLVRKTANERA